MKGYIKKMEKAANKGWAVPFTTAFPPEVWMRYWEQCAKYEKDKTYGRPVVPHR